MEYLGIPPHKENHNMDFRFKHALIKIKEVNVNILKENILEFLFQNANLEKCCFFGDGMIENSKKNTHHQKNSLW